MHNFQALLSYPKSNCCYPSNFWFNCSSGFAG